jgi:acetyl-CoA carboxylase biotin carboxylase subunit
MPDMIRKLLIANRGEIAVRVIRACRDLGISPVAVYSEADRTAVHVAMADEAVLLGPPPAAQSYLSIPKVVAAAVKSGADAVHPGYGFLAENAEFARAVVGAGLIFVGPTPTAMETMGSKITARRAALAAGVAVVPGTVEPLTSFAQAKKLAADFGYPVMLKAAAGGGGKGMRLVESYDELLSAFETAQSEATAAFGDSSLYLEKAIERPRHIEIQVFADAYGNTVHLGERECSIQRRHQKVIEECPSPIDDAELRERMGTAAVRIARAVDYTGAGTVEFLIADATHEFYFLEMNTRLQVEHPVTELVTGLDLVREQITVAGGAHLSFSQQRIHWRGHAIECRIYAEDAENDFIPSPGKITFLRSPSGPGVRDDTGVQQGSEVSIHYDPMISKLAVWGRNRQEAIDRLRSALDEYVIEGIKTTLGFFRNIVRDPEFRAGNLDTGFISRFNKRREHVLAGPLETEEQIREKDLALITAALHYLKLQRQASEYRQLSRDQNRWKVSGRRTLARSLGTNDPSARSLFGKGKR